MRIAIFTTGGTIDKVYFDAKGQYQIGDPTAPSIFDRARVSLPYEVIPFAKMDSLDMQQNDREALRDAIEKHPASHILVTHGTDTMTATAQIVSTVKDKVIVFTGATKPAIFRETEADFNVGCALGALLALQPGTYVVINGQIFDPFKVRKNFQTESFEQIA